MGTSWSLQMTWRRDALASSGCGQKGIAAAVTASSSTLNKVACSEQVELILRQSRQLLLGCIITIQLLQRCVRAVYFKLCSAYHRQFEQTLQAETNNALCVLQVLTAR
jgi:hypothetical protein